MLKPRPPLHTPEYRAFKKLLISVRHEAGLTQADVAKRLRRPQSFVAKVELGERRVDMTEFILFAKALGIDPKALFVRYLKLIGHAKS